MNYTARTTTTGNQGYLEEGDALTRLNAGHPPPAGHTRPTFDVIVIGAGQAGLSVGFHLARLGLDFVILEADERIGDVWRRRWDSLRLFTPARYDGLTGMPFPGPRTSSPRKDEMADYLEAYAHRFDLPVQTGTEVTRLRREADRYVVHAGGRELEAAQVVVAMSNFQQPRIPDVSRALDTDIVQLHSSGYRNPLQLREGGVLIVGAGNSGAEIAKELAGRHPIWLSGRHPGHLPFHIDGLAGRTLLVPLVLRFLFHRLITIATPLGRKLRPTIQSRGGPLIRVKPKELDAVGVRRVPRTAGVENGLPRLADGQVLDVANVVWCTGFHPGFSWIELPAVDDSGSPLHSAGMANDQPGLYFVGLHFLYSVTSAMIHGVGRDAERIAKAIAERRRAGAASAGVSRSAATAAR